MKQIEKGLKHVQETLATSFGYLKIILQETLATSFGYLKIILLELVLFSLFLYDLWRFIRAFLH